MKKILIIEDELDVRRNIEEILRLEGFDVRSASEGSDGVRLAKEWNPDLIICDILMPEMDGYEVLTEVRRISSLITTSFVFLTAKATKQDIRKGMELGADDYLTKPFKIEELLAMIRAQEEKQVKAEKPLNDMLFSLTYILPHELLTPLTPILGFSRLLQQEEYASDKQEVMKIGAALRKSSLRLKRLMENYLLYVDLRYGAEIGQRSSRNQSPLFREFINLGDMQAYFYEFARAARREKDLIVDLPDVELPIDGSALSKIFEELLDNALKFSPPGTPVKISSLIQEQEIKFFVSDEGWGMTSEQISRIGPFIQFERDKHEQQGMGLGLFIASKLAESENGALELVPRAHKGLTAVLTFPERDIS